MNTDWRQMLSDLAITTNQPIHEGLINLAMMIDLLKITNNPELKKAVEEALIKAFKGIK
jgi:hypothetical protein